MADIDDFATRLLEEAKRFLEKSAAASDDQYREAHLHAALLLAFSSLEAHVNSVCDEFSGRPELSIHERGLLLEKEVKLERGEYKLSGLKMVRLEDRMEFLRRKFSGKPISKSEGWCAALDRAVKLRNRLTHPKAAEVISVEAVSDAVNAIIEAIDAMYQAIYKKKFPAAVRGLNSQFSF